MHALIRANFVDLSTGSSLTSIVQIDTLLLTRALIDHHTHHDQPQNNSLLHRRRRGSFSVSRSRWMALLNTARVCRNDCVTYWNCSSLVFPSQWKALQYAAWQSVDHPHTRNEQLSLAKVWKITDYSGPVTMIIALNWIISFNYIKISNLIYIIRCLNGLQEGTII